METTEEAKPIPTPAVLNSLPLTGMETSERIVFRSLPPSFKFFTPHGDGNLGETLQWSRRRGGSGFKFFTPHGDGNLFFQLVLTSRFGFKFFTPHGDGNFRFRLR